VRECVADCLAAGLTGIHEMGAELYALASYRRLLERGQLPFRNYVAVAGRSTSTWEHYRERGPERLGDGRLSVGALKLMADGALGSRGAALLDPYSDDPHNSGLLVSDPKHIQDVATRGLRAGFQVNVHAIGDRGNRVVLDAFEAALKAVPRADHRFRVEHAQILNFDDIPRFAALDVIPSMQAVHQTSDMYWAGTRLGSTRLLGAYAWRSLLDTGVPVPNGSDFPVELVNPLRSFHAAVSRQDANDWPAGGWHPEQRMTREEALRSMTIWPAYAGFQEDVLGSLTPGKYADFVVLDQDIMRVPAELILSTRVLSTWVGGKKVYEAR
jgi:predicted amidohydrolase YtcJ